jgi:hypothetical protein
MGKCSNERGITCASNMGKTMERILDKRARKKVKISDAQAGGKEKRATTDHLLILKETIKLQSARKKPIYLAYLDVTKAYDKAWSDGIMYALHKNGLEGPLWNIIRKLNEGLQAQIKTKDGLTRKIKIKDSIRQGGVLSVLQYATVMDEIAKQMMKENIGIEVNGQEKVGCLLWMDDVVLLAKSEKELQKMLDITKRVADEYHIVFGKEKSKVMVLNRKNKEQSCKLGTMELESAGKYKYLGEIINSTKNIKDQLEEARKKAEGALQTILIIAGDPTLKNIEMEVIWKLVETCIIPIITYGGETWDMNKNETKTANRILDNILKRLLITPTTTPREAIYEEIGMLDIEHILMKNRINMYARLEKTKNEMIGIILGITNDNGWNEKTMKMITEQNLQGLLGLTNGNLKTETSKKIGAMMKAKIDLAAESKSKVGFLITNKIQRTNGKTSHYMERMNRNEASTIFKARTRMLDIKNNFRGKYTDLSCRACGGENETQEHVMEYCTVLHKDEEKKVTKEAIFTEDIESLRTTALRVNLIMEEIKSAVQNNALSGDLEECTQTN